MMEYGERRIRSLKLRVRDGSQQAHARHLLEEAFRTASLPGLPPNAMVLIRRLDLGKIRPELSSVQLADTISEAVRSLAAQAICIDQHPATDANVVWFSDPLLPYQLVLQGLLDGLEMDAWYWHSLFPDYSLVLNEQLLTQILIEACQTSVKGLAVAVLINSFLIPFRLPRFLAMLTPALARRLLNEQGMSPLALSASSLHYQEASTSNAELAGEIPAPDLPLAWRGAIQSAIELWGVKDVRSRWLAVQGLLFYRPAFIEQRDTWRRIDLGQWLQAWAQTESDTYIDEGDASILNVTLPNLAVAPNKTQLRDSNKSSINKIESQQIDLESNRTAAQSDNPQQQATNDSIDESNLVESGNFSSHAGFVYLIPLFQRLGMAELVQQYASLMMADFPRQLLWHMAKRFGLEEHDPSWQLFNKANTTHNIIIKQFEAPATWHLMLQHAHHASRFFPLNTSALRLEDLINRFQLLCALYLRRYCDLSLRSLIKRPGRVVLSQTHWDVLFDINQTDLRLRRVALDSDPGWVAWLGKVVQFHFDSEG